MARRDWLWFGNLVIAAALLAWFTNEQGVLQGDVVVYDERLDAILGGALPYREAPFEHLPFSLLPLLAAAALETLSNRSFLLALAVVNTALLASVAWFAGRIAGVVGEPDGPRRWLLVAGPLFPIVLFRLDPISLLLAAIALWSLLQNHARNTALATLAGIAARGWPIVFVAAEWRQGWKRLAGATVAVTGVMAALLLATPGFNEVRAFDGVQIETVTGSILLLGGHVTGSGPEIQEIAGSLYVGTGWLPGAVNATVGAAVMGLAALRVRSRLPAIALLALATYGLPLLSPLLSAQMLLWPTLFVALLATAPHRLAAATGVITTALLVWWQPAASWWAAVTVLRNGLLIATVLLIARPRSSDEGQPKISRKNLPV
ncbi:MAG TPA: hypothetical protein VLG28_06335 [Acidimicrobiia bacterium]|nr:hypothetical protein [Acidimicrobiia bacterium]